MPQTRVRTPSGAWPSDHSRYRREETDDAERDAKDFEWAEYAFELLLVAQAGELVLVVVRHCDKLP